MNTGIVTLNGVSRLRSWQPGALDFLMNKRGFGLDHAQDLATKLGFCIEDSRTKNLVVTSGKTLAADLLLDVQSTGLTYHALGTGTTEPAAGNVALGTEVARKVWTTRGRSLNVLTFSVFYLSTESTFFVKECGVFGGALASSTPGSGILFSRYLQSVDNSGGTKDLTFDYELTVS